MKSVLDIENKIKYEWILKFLNESKQFKNIDSTLNNPTEMELYSVWFTPSKLGSLYYIYVGSNSCGLCFFPVDIKYERNFYTSKINLYFSIFKEYKLKFISYYRSYEKFLIILKDTQLTHLSQFLAASELNKSFYNQSIEKAC